jgi:uncharacterized protein YbaR (Trm112 family)
MSNWKLSDQVEHERECDKRPKMTITCPVCSEEVHVVKQSEYSAHLKPCLEMSQQMNQLAGLAMKEPSPKAKRLNATTGHLLDPKSNATPSVPKLERTHTPIHQQSMPSSHSNFLSPTLTPSGTQRRLSTKLSMGETRSRRYCPVCYNPYEMFTKEFELHVDDCLKKSAATGKMVKSFPSRKPTVAETNVSSFASSSSSDDFLRRRLKPTKNDGHRQTTLSHFIDKGPSSSSSTTTTYGHLGRIHVTCPWCDQKFHFSEDEYMQHLCACAEVNEPSRRNPRGSITSTASVGSLVNKHPEAQELNCEVCRRQFTFTDEEYIQHLCKCIEEFEKASQNKRARTSSYPSSQPKSQLNSQPTSQPHRDSLASLHRPLPSHWPQQPTSLSHSVTVVPKLPPSPVRVPLVQKVTFPCPYCRKDVEASTENEMDSHMELCKIIQLETNVKQRQSRQTTGSSSNGGFRVEYPTLRDVHVLSDMGRPSTVVTRESDLTIAESGLPKVQTVEQSNGNTSVPTSKLFVRKRKTLFEDNDEEPIDISTLELLAFTKAESASRNVDLNASDHVHEPRGPLVDDVVTQRTSSLPQREVVRIRSRSPARHRQLSRTTPSPIRDVSDSMQVDESAPMEHVVEQRPVQRSSSSSTSGLGQLSTSPSAAFRVAPTKKPSTPAENSKKSISSPPPISSSRSPSPTPQNPTATPSSENRRQSSLFAFFGWGHSSHSR